MTTKDVLALALEALAANEFHLVEVGKRGNGLHAQTVKAITAIKQAQQAHQALIGCVEHLEFSTPQGRAAYEAAKAAINQAPIADSELSGMWSNSDFTGGATDCDLPAPKQAQEPVTKVSWNLKYADSTPKLHVGNSAFEDWFQAQPFATQIGVKQMCRDSSAAGMGDPLVTYATHPAPKQAEPAWQPIESAPNGTMVLFANMSPRIQASEWCFVAWMADGKLCGHRMDKPTHWMPLPTPPEAKA